MAKRKNKGFLKKFKKRIFGPVFNIWDVVLLSLILPYFYLVWIGFTPQTGLGRIYFNIIGPSASIGIVISVLINFIQKKAKKSKSKKQK